MSRFDVVIRHGTLVTTIDERVFDVGISQGKVAALEPSLGGDAAETIDASGLHIFPGLIDSHVHFNEPGRTEWEGLATGSRAHAAGGGTLFFDMPLNAHPPTIDGASFDKKLAAAQAKSVTDFAFWGGLVPGNADKMEELSARGVVGFKAFMADSGIEDFPRVTDRTLRAGMKRAAQLKRPVAVHAESEKIIQTATQRSRKAGHVSVRDFLGSRPIRAELEAIQRAIELAGETGCALHIVHVSCGEGIALIHAARTKGMDVTCETCPHYLVLTEEDMVKIGALAKCAPPLRSKSTQESLWNALKLNQLTTIGSDHSPSPPEMKTDPNFFKVWGGISGVQHTLALLLTEGQLKRQLPLPQIARLISANVAERFNLPPSKGRLEIGSDADLALLDLRASFIVKAGDLQYRHKHSPYVGRSLTAKLVRTILRGQTVVNDGEMVSGPIGRLVKPAPI
jgi:allantoinase